ncbi:MAG: hypothetical protein ACFFBD_11620 [Candidatus Hodarchaeota archaeon]
MHRLRAGSSGQDPGLSNSFFREGERSTENRPQKIVDGSVDLEKLTRAARWAGSMGDVDEAMPKFHVQNFKFSMT